MTAVRLSEWSRPPASNIVRFPGGLLPVTSFRDARVSTDARDFVEGVLVSGGMSIVYGETNCGKTFFAADLALRVACGWTWFGCQVDRCGALFCALEGAHGITNRVAAFRSVHGLDECDIPFGIAAVPLNLLDSDADIDALIATVSAEGARTGVVVGLIVIDTLSRALAGGNENGPDDMGLLVGTSDRIRAETGAHVLWVHHSGKDQARGARGHSLLRAATDTEIEVTADGPTRTARVTKQRDLECTGEFVFTLKTVELGTNARGKPITSCVVDEGETPGRGHAAGAASSILRRLTGHNKRALEVLIDLVAASGQAGYAGVPSGVLSVPEKWWRERFYDRAMPDAEQEAKKRAFRRAADSLVGSHTVGVGSNRVWVVRHIDAQPGHKPEGAS